MIRVSPQTIHTSASLATQNAVALLEEAISRVIERSKPYIQAKNLKVELEVHSGIDHYPVFNSSEVLEALIKDAANSAEAGAELSVYAEASEEGVEIEVGVSRSLFYENLASGAAIKSLQVVTSTSPAFSPRDSAQLTDGDTRETLRTYCTRCPQGGFAWTLFESSRHQSKLARSA